MDDLDRCKNLLRDLVAFPTLSGQSTRAIADYVSDYLSQFGVTSQYFTDDSGEMINLFATIGPEIDGGVILSGHFDVVPADPRGWESDPFELTERNDRLYGRGSVDMKGFLAMVLASVPQMVKAADKLQRPFHIAFTYDEETCSYGVRELVKAFPALGFKPGAAIVGEPTGMTPIVGHKGGCELETVFRGKAGHASRPGEGVNAIQYAARLVTHLYDLSADLASHPQPGSPFDPPYSTINVGRIEGGEARNIIAGECRLSWEIRPIPEDDSSQILDGIKAFINDELVPDMQAVDPGAGVYFSEEAYFPALPAEHGPALKLVQDAWQTSAPQVVSFGTDGGCFSSVGISTVVCGPGDLDRAHKPNEYIEIAELAEGLEFLSRLGKCLQVAK